MCIIPVLMPVLFIYTFLGDGYLPIPIEYLNLIIAIYLWSGLVVLIVDLWRQKVSKEKKIMWTVLSLLLVFSLPIYWYFRFFRFTNETDQN